MATNIVEPLHVSATQNHYAYTQLSTRYDEQNKAMWYYMHGKPRPCFSLTLLEELGNFRDKLRLELDSPDGRNIQYMVLASGVPGVFNLGGDLDVFMRYVISKNREGLFDYAKACIDLAYANYYHLERDIMSIALVKGEALGGGFEGALSSNVLIAERSARMGFPEVIFNLFPGMGAYSFLHRKIGRVKTEQMVLSGELYSAEEMLELGVIDILAEDGEGEAAVNDYIRKSKKSFNAIRAYRSAINAVDPLTFEELLTITEHWVDAALRLNKRDLRMMERLVKQQTRLSGTHCEEIASQPSATTITTV